MSPSTKPNVFISISLPGNILDDTELIANLKSSTQAGIKINQTLKDAETTAQEISVARESYRAVAKRGSTLYFVIASLALVDPMYQYSLQFFKGLYQTRIKESAPSEVGFVGKFRFVSL